MLQAGIGDMIAKYISICEWRIAHLLVGEYYCGEIAQLVRNSLSKCVMAVPGLKERKPEAAAEVCKGLVLTGIAMQFAGLSRPASGMEHYFSHIWDMRRLEFGTPGSLHGIQCAVGTMLSLQVYEEIVRLTPDEKKG